MSADTSSSPGFYYKSENTINSQKLKYTPMTTSPISIGPLIWYLIALLLLLTINWATKRRSRLNYPPGPKGLPIVGNAFDLPASDEWVTVQEWSKKYGPLVFIKNFGKPYLFLNDYNTMVDLLEKRGNIYSSRPENIAIKLEGWDSWFIAMFKYGDELQRSRQMLHRFFQVSKVEDYYDVQTHSTHKLLEGLLHHPEDFARLIRTWAGRIIMKITYGYDVQDTNDPFVEIAENGLNAFHKAEGVFLLNALPWLRVLPKFRELLDEGRKASTDMRRKPHEYSKKNVLSGKAIPSISSKLIESHLQADGSIKDEGLISNVTAIVYAAGSHTTVAASLTAILALLLHPEVQKRAHEELDRVVGKNLPTIKDRPNLPYIDAIFKESFRWQAITPLGLAHTVSQDDEYMGYHIPEGTTIFANIWAAFKDPLMYPEPEKFMPERWLDTSKELPLPSNKMGFGFGRRLCPGRYFAENSVFIAISSILATFHIDMEVGEDNVPIPPPIDYIPDFVRQPKPFKCIFRPRSDAIPALIAQAIETAK